MTPTPDETRERHAPVVPGATHSQQLPVPAIRMTRAAVEAPEPEPAPSPSPSPSPAPGPASWLPALVGVGLLGTYLVLVGVLLSWADDTRATETIWSRWHQLFAGVEALALAAAGFFFGREVNRARAESAERRADSESSNAREATAQVAIRRREAHEANARGRALARELRATTDAVPMSSTVGTDAASELVRLATIAEAFFPSDEPRLLPVFRELPSTRPSKGEGTRGTSVPRPMPMPENPAMSNPPDDSFGFTPPPPPNPIPPTRAERGEADEGFESPSAGKLGKAPAALQYESPPERAAARMARSALADDLLGFKRDIEAQLAERLGNREAAVRAGDVRAFAVAPVGLNNVLGVGIGPAFADERGGTADRTDDGPGSPSLILYVAEPTAIETVRSTVARQMGVRALASEALPTTVVVTGIIDARAHRFAIVPAPCGCSIGHFNITAGTLGALARGRNGDRRNRLFVLSNNHVIADSNSGAAGDCVCQPGPDDGGSCPAGSIAILERFITLDFSGAPNAVDAAVAWADPAKVRRDFLYLRSGAPAFFRVGSKPGMAAVNMIVGKSGRTTQVTQGRVASVTATVTVNYGGGRMALFRDQIEVRDIEGRSFSQGGDSGSLVWMHDEARVPVGLLFAGGGQSTFVNHIDDVLNALDVDLVT